MNGNRRADEEAVRGLIDHLVNGWAAGDPEAYAAVFSQDADYVTFLGTHYKGRQAIAASYVPLFRKVLKGTRLEIDITHVRFLAPDVALIHANATVVRRRRNRRNARVNTSVAVRTDGRWLLAASQNTTHRRLAETLMAKLFS